MTNYEVGGKISVTLKDGTKIVDSPIVGPAGSYPSYRAIANESVCLVSVIGVLGKTILSVDSYTPPTPPTPAWAAENVRIIQSMSLGFAKAYRETLDGSPLSDCWVIEGDSISTLDLQAMADDWEIYGVAP